MRRAVAIASALLLLSLGPTHLSGEPNGPPKPVEITFQLWLTGPDSAAGLFTASGAIVDAGMAEQEFTLVPDPMDPEVVLGTKTLMGNLGTITLRFVARVTPLTAYSSVAKGRFVVVDATGAYEGLGGNGTSYAELDMSTYSIAGVYEGMTY